MIKNWTFYACLLLMLISGHLLAEERMKLDDTAIQGARELPKITYIVPWKSSKITEIGNLSQKSSFKENMQALDREVFRKELEYFSMLEGAGRQTQQQTQQQTQLQPKQ